LWNPIDTLSLFVQYTEGREATKEKEEHACDKGKYEQYLARHQSHVGPVIPCDFNPILQRPGRFECFCLLIS
jgi:hypothetical protein